MASASNGLRPLLSFVLVAGIAAAIGAGVVFALRANAEPEPKPLVTAQALTESQKQEVEQTVRDYLLQNPEILIEMSNILEERQHEAQSQAMVSALAENADALYRSNHGYTAGNPDGDVTVVEFFDYNCGFCRRAFQDVLRLIEDDPNVRVVFKELPILRRESEGAARVALAARNQGKYFELHQALLEASGLASEASALALAADLGLDVDRLKQDMASKEVETALEETRNVAQRLRVQGTPLYIIGDRIVPGAPEDLYEQLAAHVEQVRKNGCAAPIAC